MPFFNQKLWTFPGSAIISNIIIQFSTPQVSKSMAIFFLDHIFNRGWNLMAHGSIGANAEQTDICFLKKKTETMFFGKKTSKKRFCKKKQWLKKHTKKIGNNFDCWWSLARDRSLAPRGPCPCVACGPWIWTLHDGCTPRKSARRWKAATWSPSCGFLELGSFLTVKVICSLCSCSLSLYNIHMYTYSS